jgi:hypothetical protein
MDYITLTLSRREGTEPDSIPVTSLWICHRGAPLAQRFGLRRAAMPSQTTTVMC